MNEAKISIKVYKIYSLLLQSAFDLRHLQCLLVRQQEVSRFVNRREYATEKVKYHSSYPFKEFARTMSKNHVGRGRGWLNLNKNKSVPGNTPQPITSVGSPPRSIIQCMNETNIFVDAPEYEFLFNALKQLNVDDDGIKFNQKIRHLLETWEKGCPTSNEVKKSFHAVYQACLHDDELASKLVFLMSSSTLIAQEVREKNIRLLFLFQLQKTVDGSISLYKTDPEAFRNCTRMLGEFFNRGRLANGDPFSFLAVRLVGNLQILLENARIQDLQLLATQLYLNGFGLRGECPKQFTKLLFDARIKLISNELTEESKMWLLLCIDGASNKFGLFSSDLIKFYQNNIGEAVMPIIQRTPSILRIKTNQGNKILDSYQSDVNVLQMSNLTDSSIDKSSRFSAFGINTLGAQECSSGFVSDSCSHKSSSSYESSSRNLRMPRMPILGIGARLDRYNSDSGAGSTCKDGGSGRGGKPNGGCGDLSDIDVLSVSSTDKSPQFCTSDTDTSDISQECSSGFGSDTSSHTSSSRMPRMPILSVRNMLSRYNT